MQENALIVDVRNMVPRDRHPTIFGAWREMAEGKSLVLVNDHDPVPLYYQFAAEYSGGFHWEYLEQGPDVWRVRISKGEYKDPGFVPNRFTKISR